MTEPVEPRHIAIGKGQHITIFKSTTTNDYVVIDDAASAKNFARRYEGKAAALAHFEMLLVKYAKRIALHALGVEVGR